MATLSERFLERLGKAQRWRSDILEIAGEMSGLSASDYDTLATGLIEGGEDHALGILLNAASVNKIKFDPAVLAIALKVVKDIRDIRFPYDFQDEKAIDPLLALSLSEDISYERQAFAAHLAAELSINFGCPKQPVRKVLWQLAEQIHSPEARLLLNATIEMVEKGDKGGERSHRLLGGDVLSELPAEKPPVVLGDGGTVRRPVAKLGRNEPCRCGSGRKYKKCCYDKDRETLRDASSYEGVTMSQLRENPSLADDASYIGELRPYEIRKLVPSKMNDEQLFAAYRRADRYGLREVAFDMLLELKGRPGKDVFAVEHMGDLFDSAIEAQDTETIRKLVPHVPEESRYLGESNRLKHELIETPEKFRDLEALCRKAFDHSDGHLHQLLEMSYAFKDILPALSLVFGRVAIVSEPQRSFDNEVLIDAIRETRIALDLEPWGDPVEDYWDWITGREEDWTKDQDKDEAIRRLREQLSEAMEKGLSAQRDLRDKEKDLANMERRLRQTNLTPPAERTAQPPGKTGGTYPAASEYAREEQSRDIDTLKMKIGTLKDEIRSQQESRRQLRQELKAAHEKISIQGAEKAPAVRSQDEETTYPSGIPEKVHVPEFTDAFHGSCEGIPPVLVIKAMKAAVGFGARDSTILRQTVPIERLPGYYRIRIGLHHRLMLRRTPGNTLQILELIQRKYLDTWIRKHAS